MRLRLALGAAGVALGLYGVYRLLTTLQSADLKELLVWLVVALVLHDGVLSPIIVVVGSLLSVVPSRARAALQGGLVAGALITVVALPLIRREHTQPAVKAILRQDFGANLAILLAVVAAGSLAYYLALVVQDRRS